MSETPLIPATHHPMTIAALARLAAQGGWARILQGKALENDDDLIDAELLCAAHVLRPITNDAFELLDTHPWFYDPETLAAGLRATLRHALRHAEGRDRAWSAHDLDLVADQGRSSAAAAITVGESLLQMMPSTHGPSLEGRGRLLDVGVGAGVFARELCRLFPGAKATGIDVLPEVVDLARAAVMDAKMGHRIELRVQSITALQDSDAFDLAWLPQAFVPRSDLVHGLPRVFDALRPDRWLISPICSAPARETNSFTRAVSAHQAHLTGGGPLSTTAMSGLLLDAGFVDIRHHDQGDQVLTLARRPPNRN